MAVSRIEPIEGAPPVQRKRRLERGQHDAGRAAAETRVLAPWSKRRQRAH